VRIADSLQALTAYGASDVGRVRTVNEDTFICDGDRGIFAVIDGVGGHAGGEVAASIARRELELRLRRETGTVEDRIREAIAAANASILAEAERVPALTRMACVLTVAVATPGNVVIGHVGDTRLYKLGPAGLHKLTHDHSPVGQLEDRGHLREEEAMHHPERNQVYREVGTQPRQPTDAEFIEIVTAPFAADEAILLCSDGLSDQVTSAEIEAIVRRAADPAAAVTDLLRAANAAGGRDNTTVILATRPLFGERGAWQATGRRDDTSELIPSGDARRSTRETHAVRPNDERPLSTGSADRSRPSYGRALLYATATTVLATAILWPTETLSPAETTTASPSAPRVLLVSSAAGAGYTSIGAALAAAQAGDVIDVAAGLYREPVVLKEGVSIRARERRASILQPPDGSGSPWTAISATSIRSGDISGFMVKGTDSTPLEYGVRVSDASVELDDLDIAGARAAAVLVAGHSAVRLRSSHIHDNAGAGVVVDSGAVPEILHNVITGNGRLLPPRPGIELRPGARGTIIGNIVKGNGQSIAGASPAELTRLGAQNAIEATPPAAGRRGAR
jgi:serine/threonine protein phosphatase PrpC